MLPVTSPSTSPRSPRLPSHSVRSGLALVSVAIASPAIRTISCGHCDPDRAVAPVIEAAMNQIAIRPTAWSVALSSLADHGRAVSGARYSHGRTTSRGRGSSRVTSARDPQSPGRAGRKGRVHRPQDRQPGPDGRRGSVPRPTPRRGTWSSMHTHDRRRHRMAIDRPVVLDTTYGLMPAHNRRTLTPPTLIGDIAERRGSPRSMRSPCARSPCHRCTGLRSAVGHPPAADSDLPRRGVWKRMASLSFFDSSCCSTSPSSVIAIQPSPQRRHVHVDDAISRWCRSSFPCTTRSTTSNRRSDRCSTATTGMLNSSSSTTDLTMELARCWNVYGAPTPAHCDPLRAAPRSMPSCTPHDRPAAASSCSPTPTASSPPTRSRSASGSSAAIRTSAQCPDMHGHSTAKLPGSPVFKTSGTTVSSR